MLNAVQARMVEEALVEREVYEAMVKLRTDIGRIVGPSAEPAAAGAGGGRAPVPDLDDLPEGKPPPWHPDAKRAAASAPVPGGSQLPLDAAVPPEVLALGDPGRDHHRPLAPYQQETKPRGGGGDPFPQLGPMGRPLG